jgi:hypothetical protein
MKNFVSKNIASNLDKDTLTTARPVCWADALIRRVLPVPSGPCEGGGDLVWIAGDDVSSIPLLEALDSSFPGRRAARMSRRHEWSHQKPLPLKT